MQRSGELLILPEPSSSQTENQQRDDVPSDTSAKEEFLSSTERTVQYLSSENASSQVG